MFYRCGVGFGVVGHAGLLQVWQDRELTERPDLGNGDRIDKDKREVAVEGVAQFAYLVCRRNEAF